MIPVENVRLLRVEGGGFTKNYRQTEGDDDPLWQGDVGAHLVERVVTEINGLTVDPFRRSRLTVPIVDGIEVERKQTVVYSQDGEEVKREVKDLEELDVGVLRLYLVDA